MTSDTTAYTGHMGLTSSGSDHNAEELHINELADARRIAVPVRIVALHGGGEDAAPTADVVPLIHQVDGLNQPTPHATVYGVPVGRVHSGAGAIIADPEPGDDYVMSVADRDLSKYKASGQAAAPDTKRRGSLSDGMLLHAIMAKKPTQFIRFKPGGGVRIVDAAGAVIETFADSKTVTIAPPSGGTVVLGGTGSDGGTYDFVMTKSGASSVVKAKV